MPPVSSSGGLWGGDAQRLPRNLVASTQTLPVRQSLCRRRLSECSQEGRGRTGLGTQSSVGSQACARPLRTTCEPIPPARRVSHEIVRFALDRQHLVELRVAPIRDVGSPGGSAGTSCGQCVGYRKGTPFKCRCHKRNPLGRDFGPGLSPIARPWHLVRFRARKCGQKDALIRALDRGRRPL